jgi:hypothetical protein
MTYKFTLSVPGADPIVEEGDMGSFSDLLVKIKRQFAQFLFDHSDVPWIDTSGARVSIEFLTD